MLMCAHCGAPLLNIQVSEGVPEEDKEFIVFHGRCWEMRARATGERAADVSRYMRREIQKGADPH